jgi:transcriptional accessory protein Tex/SPT6
MAAREKGLEPLGELIRAQKFDPRPLPEIVVPYLSNEVPGVQDALQGGRDIVAE